MVNSSTVSDINGRCTYHLYIITYDKINKILMFGSERSADECYKNKETFEHYNIWLFCCLELRCAHLKINTTTVSILHTTTKPVFVLKSFVFFLCILVKTFHEFHRNAMSA